MARQGWSGFTLIEMLVTVAVAAVLLGVAVPNFADFIANNRARTELQSLVMSLQFARSEAVKRGQLVQVSSLDGSNWHAGWRVWLDANGDGSFDAGEELRDGQAFNSAATLVAGNSVGALAFNSQGAVELAAGESISFAYRSNPSKCSRDRNARLTQVGHVSVSALSCS